MNSRKRLTTDLFVKFNSRIISDQNLINTEENLQVKIKRNRELYMNVFLRVRTKYRDKLIEFLYRWRGKIVSVPVTLVTSRCNYGGVRYWFECPSCGHRKGVLYLYETMECRTCLDLIYPSQLLYGFQKEYGSFKNARELYDMKKSLKRWQYNGLPTKKYKRFLRHLEKTNKVGRDFLGKELPL